MERAFLALAGLFGANGGSRFFNHDGLRRALRRHRLRSQKLPTFTVRFYSGTPTGNGFSTTISSTFVYSGPSERQGQIQITDNEAGIEGQTLDDDSNGAETATGTATIFGSTSTNSTVDAEVSWTIRDTVTLEEFEVVQLEVEAGAAAGNYTLAELPLIPGRTYEVLDYNTNPDVNAGAPVFTYSEYVCFASDTLICTPKGPRPVQQLRVGDQVQTVDNGPQPLVWIGRRRLTFGPQPHRQKPIEFKPGSLGAGLPARPLRVSPQHRIALVGPGRAPANTQVLACAKSLVDRPKVRQMRGLREVQYFALMTPRHELLFANGTPVESFYPGKTAMSLLPWLQRFQVLAVCPGVLQNVEKAYGPLARPVLTAKQVRLFDKANVRGSTTAKNYLATGPVGAANSHPGLVQA